MSPIFSSGKLKGMMEPIAEEMEKYIEILEEDCKKGKPINIKERITGNQIRTITKKEFENRNALALSRSWNERHMQMCLWPRAGCIQIQKSCRGKNQESL